MNKSLEDELANIDLNALELVALAAASQASDLQKGGFYSELEISVKSHPHDLVTQYDVLSEELIVSVIREKFPDHGFVGEEKGLQGDISDKIIWIIDPIDGTWNFAKQIPAFAISIAAHYKGITLVGVCLDPISNELFVAQRGGGATMNGKKISVTNTEELEMSGLSIGISAGTPTLHKLAQIRRTGSTVLDLCYVAKGALEGFVEERLNVWDYAAAKLIVEEAGGQVTKLDGSPLLFEMDKPTTILASNKKVHKEIIKWISTGK